MKQTNNRQNKLIQVKAEIKHFPREHHLPSEKPATDMEGSSVARGGAVYGLVSDILFASKIAQAAKHVHLAVHNFDKAEPLLQHTKQRPPVLIILDWDRCEAEAFKVLKELSSNADLKSVPSVGYLSQIKAPLKEEAQRAGCHRVYTKTEFTRSLEDLLVRYSQ